jgi:hypothetical protein
MDTPEQPKSSSDEIVNELRDLGNNLKNILQSVWESEERKKTQKDIENGLNELATTLSKTANDFANSPTGQTLKADVADFQQRVRTGEVETKVRNEVLSALRAANDGLKKAAPREEPPSERSK